MVLTLIYLYCGTISEGERLYQTHCANCHMEAGQGLAQLIPPLANADYLLQNYSKLPCIIRKGQNQKIVVNGIVYEQEMPSNFELNIVEITNVINYIGNAWGNNMRIMTTEEVEKALNGCQ